MTSELRPAVEVWWKATDAWKEGLSPEDGTEAAAAVIEADREAVRAPLRAEVAKWRDKYNELGQLALEQMSDLGTKLGRAEVELDAAKADLQGANRELAKFKALAETLAGALGGSIGSLEFSRDYHKDLGNKDQAFAQDRLDAATQALREYKEARDAS